MNVIIVVLYLYCCILKYLFIEFFVMCFLYKKWYINFKKIIFIIFIYVNVDLKKYFVFF